MTHYGYIFIFKLTITKGLHYVLRSFQAPIASGERISSLFKKIVIFHI